MVQIYSPVNTDFTKNGNMTLMPTSCIVYAEINGPWYLTMEHPIDAEGRWEYIEEEAVIKVKTWQTNEQLFRIQRVTKEETGILVEAYPIFMDARDDGFIIDKRPTNRQGSAALYVLFEDLPSKYTYRCDITKASTAYFENRNLIDCLCGESPNFVERWGGEIQYNNYEVDIYTRLGSDRNVEIRYGKNILGMTYEVDMSEIATRIYPQAYNGHRMYGETPWVDSPLINNYAKLYVKKVVYENVRMAEDVTGEEEEELIVCNTQQELDAALTQCCQDDFAAGVDRPKVNLDIDLVTLADTEEYKDVAISEAIYLGDTVHCTHSLFNVTTDARAIAIEYDCLTQMTKRVVIGDFTYDYIRDMQTTVSRIDGAIRKDGSVVADRVAGFLDGARTSLRAQYDIAKKQDVIAILFENLDPTSPVYGATAIGTQGLMISKTRNSSNTGWVWTTAGTANGFVADTIVTGLLSDQQGKNYWDMDTGGFRLAADATVGDQGLKEFISEGTRTNLLLDVPGFTEEYWTVDSTLERDSLVYGITDPFGGTKAIRLKKPTSSSDGEAKIYPDTTTNFPFTNAGKEYTFSVWLRSSHNATRGIDISCCGQTLRVYPTTSWQEYKITAKYTRKSDGTVEIGGNYNSSSGFELYIYNPRVEFTDWFDTQQGVFNQLTMNGQLQGIYMQDGQLYINASMINAGLLKGNLIDAKNLVVRNNNNQVTFSIDDNGAVTGNFSSLWIAGEGYETVMADIAKDNQKKYTQEEVFNILTNNGATSGIFLVNGELYINGDFINVDDLRAIVAKIGGFIIGADEIKSVPDEVTGTSNLHLYKSGRASFGGDYQTCVNSGHDFTSKAYPYLDENGWFHKMSVKDFVYVDGGVDIEGKISGWDTLRNGCSLYAKWDIKTEANLTVTGTIYNSSDARLKDNIKDADNVSDTLKGLRVRAFDWKKTKTHVSAGLIAQEVQEVIPEIVTGEDYLSISYVGIVPYLLKAWQESEKRAEDLEKRVSDLEKIVMELREAVR